MEPNNYDVIIEFQSNSNITYSEYDYMNTKCNSS